MNIRQKIALLAGIFLLVLAGLFPPYTLVTRAYSASHERFLGYYFIGTPPSAPASTTHLPVRRREGFSVRIDTTRLFIQWGIILFLTAGAVLVLKRANPTADN